MRAREFILENKVRPNIEIRWDGNFTVDAYIDGKRVGSAEFASDDPEGRYGFYAVSVGVDPAYRRMGVATAMYDAAAEKFGDIIPSEHQTDDARAFWQSYGREVVGEDTRSLEDSLEDWMEMWNSDQAAQVILASPEAQNFKKISGVSKLYRAIVPGDNDFNSIKSTGHVVAYATKIEGAIEFLRSLEIMDDWAIIEKDFRPADFLLDFTSMYEALSSAGGYTSEHEVWMKPTPYYAGVNKNEVVLTSKEYYK